MVVDNPLRAAGALAEHGHAVEQRSVLFLEVPNGPGALGRAAGLLAAADVNIEYAYASAIGSQPLAAVVVGAEDAERAATAAGV
ncbi:MAG: ACT domain-containing protein [Acidobacteria bacterium]|nr:ACT domain-containing protein [Acidobacteriota bacterium]MYN67284.1 ACT domain-containing protein [Acidobacteriota bacterium]